MRSAYGGRAAAYEKKGEYDKALADHNMVVLFYGLEVEILNGLETPERDKFLAEAAGAYRARAKCLELLGRQQAAQVDQKRADALETDAKKVAANSLKAKAASVGEVRLVNAWADAVTIVVDGVSYRLEVGEQKAIPLTAVSAPYEIRAAGYRDAGTFQVGRTYYIRSQ